MKKEWNWQDIKHAFGDDQAFHSENLTRNHMGGICVGKIIILKTVFCDRCPIKIIFGHDDGPNVHSSVEYLDKLKK